MIHELFPCLTETASGSHPCCVVSVTYDRPSYFHGVNAGSNPAGDAKSRTYMRNVYSLFKGRIGSHGFWDFCPQAGARLRMNTLICYNCIKQWYEHIR